ncbi:hypothetical protein BH10CYA1_BH10CYA1_41190 [soil metagenome]
MKTIRRTQHRNQRGNILILACFSFMALSLTLIMAYSFCGVYWLHNRLQTSADEISLAGAKKLNDRDRIGQMNNMVARCRQLVHSSRDDYDTTKKDYPDLASFAEPLLDEARTSAADLEQERKKMNAVAETEAAQAMKDRFNDIKGTYPMVLPWLTVGKPVVTSWSLGKFDDVQSNVTEFTQFAKLKDQDRTQNYVTTSASGLNLYTAEKNHKLVNTDADLDFNLSSLPPLVEKQISSARNIQPKDFVPNKAGYAPSTAQVILQLKVSTGLGIYAGSTLAAKGSALTTGAAKQQ